MNYKTISEIYDANEQIRARFKAMLNGITDDQAAMRENGEGWSVAEIVEHVAIVEHGIVRICGRLLAAGAAAGGVSNGEAKITADFLEKASAPQNAKLDAPERVAPTGGRSIAESSAMLDENRKGLVQIRDQFETVECADLTFPHPAFGALNAHDWLALIGGHEARHIAQIKRII